MTPHHFFYVYVLQSLKARGEIYIGYTRDLRKRFAQHNNSESTATKRYAPWKLAYYEAFSQEALARAREARLKNYGNSMLELKKRIGLAPLKKSGAGFTLIETLVAVAIIMLAIAGPLVSANRALVSAYIARDQLTASYLGQEGVEYVRRMRDSVYLYDYKADPSNSNLATLAFSDFTAGSIPGSIKSCFLGSGSCALLDPILPMDVSTGSTYNYAMQLCSNATCSVEGKLSLTGGRYVFNNGAGGISVFTRSIKFYTVGSEIEVVVTVSWNERGVPYSTVVTDYISPWE